MTEKKEINLELEQFTGSEVLYRHPSKRFNYTEGVQYLAQECGAYWLIEAIASWQTAPEIKQDSMLQQIQFWKLRVNPDHTAILVCERDTDDVVISQKIEWTDFPLETITLYLTDSVLLLPSEY